MLGMDEAYVFIYGYHKAYLAAENAQFTQR